MATEQELAQALGPAFGIYPKAFRGNTGNPRDAANLPVDVMRGRTAGLLGMFGDVVNQPSAFTPVRAVQLAMQGVMGQDKYPDTEHFLKTLPLKPTSRAGEVAGQAASFVPLNPAPAVRAAKAGVQALGPTASNMAEDFLMRRGLMPTLDVYHGTPHTLPPTERNPLGEFDASKIGTGEGAQAFGHGIYTAENPNVAKGYAEQLSTAQGPLGDVAKYWRKNGGESAFRSFAKDAGLSPSEIENTANVIRNTGNFYKVDLPDEKIATMLDWDKPLSEQSQYVQDAMTKIGMPLNKTGKEAYEGIGYEMGRQKGSTRSTVVPFNPAEASNFLQQQGIAGIKYLDEGSRTAGKGTRNFVTFPGEEKNLTILERNAEKSAK
jgi:hypothetical protein